MAGGALSQRIERRLQRVGLSLPAVELGQLGMYFGLLTKWNRQINLTSLPLEPVTDAAVDRLVIEPVAAAKQVQDADRVLIDLGSGGGSPAIPLRIAAPQLRLVMVESKTRKSAFLRDAVRLLELGDVEVANARFEDLLTRIDLHEAADLVSVRAVRADRRLWNPVLAFLRPKGRVFWFTTSSSTLPAIDMQLMLMSTMRLIPKSATQLAILQKP